MALSSILYTISAEFTAGDLANVSRSVNDWPQITGLVVCKIMELGVSWFSGFDGEDHLTSLRAPPILSHTPIIANTDDRLRCCFSDLAFASPASRPSDNLLFNSPYDYAVLPGSRPARHGHTV